AGVGSWSCISRDIQRRSRGCTRHIYHGAFGSYDPGTRANYGATGNAQQYDGPGQQQFSVINLSGPGSRTSAVRLPGADYGCPDAVCSERLASDSYLRGWIFLDRDKATVKDQNGRA